MPTAKSAISSEVRAAARQRAIDFVRECGIPCKEVDRLPADPHQFLKTVHVHRGELHIAPKARTSDILHEAGHLALFPANFRHYVTGNVETAIARMFDELEKSQIDSESPIVRAALQCDDAEATCWAWSAGLHLGIDEVLIIDDSNYTDSDGTPGGAAERWALRLRAHNGIEGLHVAGMCIQRSYPAMLRWVQPHFEIAPEKPQHESVFGM